MQLDDAHETAGHSHAPNDDMTAAAKLKQSMRSAVCTAPGVRPSAVMATHLLTAADGARAAVGTKEAVRRRLRRQKRGVQPREPTTLDEIDLPDDFTMTGEAEPVQFLIHDSGPTARKRMLVFSSEDQLRHLADSDRYVDTFHCGRPPLL